MNKDLELSELLEITRKALDKANKDLGFVKPVVEGKRTSEAKFVPAPFDPERDIKLLEFIPSEWGIKGTPTAEHIDAMLSNIINVGEADPIKKVKDTFSRLKAIVGPDVSDQGIPTLNKKNDSDVHELFSAIQLKATLYTIFQNNQPTVAGKIFESFIARLVGGTVSNQDEARIEDLKDAEGNFISLKAIDRATGVKGSKLNLALGIVNAVNSTKKPDAGIVYLVCVKDLESSPLYMHPFSFKINKNNYFNFILGKSSLSKKDIEDASTSILKGAFIKKAQEKGLYEARSPVEVNVDKLTEAARLYANEKLGANLQPEDKQQIGAMMKSHFMSLYAPTRNKAENTKFELQKLVPVTAPDGTQTSQKETVEENLYSIFVNNVDKDTPGLFPFFGQLENLFKDQRDPRESNRAGFVNKDLYLNLVMSYGLFSANKYNLGAYLEKNKDMRDMITQYEKGVIVNPEDRKKVNDVVASNAKEYKKIITSFLREPVVAKFFQFLSDYIKKVDEYRYGLVGARVGDDSTESSGDVITPIDPKEDIDSSIKDFFDVLSGNYDAYLQRLRAEAEETYKKSKKALLAKKSAEPVTTATVSESLMLEAKGDENTQFENSILQTQKLAAVLDADYDESYDYVIIDTGYLLNSGKEEENTVKQRLEALMENHHNTRQFYIQWFGYREVEGLSNAIKSLEQESDLVGKMLETAPQAPVQENKKNTLTDDMFNDILKKIL